MSEGLRLNQRLSLREKGSDSSVDVTVHWSYYDMEVRTLDGAKLTNIHNMYYSVDRMVTVAGVEPLDNPVTLRMDPILVRHHFGFTEQQMEENIYPASAGLTYGRLFGTELSVTLILQKEIETDTYWLLILNESDSRIVHHHPLNDYEVFFHKYNSMDKKLYRSPESRAEWNSRAEFRESLKNLPAPSWKALYRITKGIDIKDFVRGENMYETVQRLIPDNWPVYFKEMYSLGLCAILSPNLLEKDPLDFVDGFIGSDTPQILLMYYYSELVKGSSYFDIIRIINKPLTETVLTQMMKNLYKWILPLKEMEARVDLPETQPVFKQYAKELFEEQSARPMFPVTWEDAKKSRKSWNDRVTLINYVLAMTVRFNPERLGLRSILYLGGAYRWPHKHSSWMADTTSGERELQVQEMFLPLHSVEKVTRFLDRVQVTKWYSRRINHHKFDTTIGDWGYDAQKMAQQVGRRVSMRSLVRDFNIGTPGQVTVPDKKDAAILDALGSGLKYYDMERRDALWDAIGVNPQEFQTRAERMVNEGMIQLSYETLAVRYTSRFLVLRGDMRHIRALADSLLRSAPTCSVYLFEDSAFIIVSMHPDKMITFIQTLLPLALESDVLVEEWKINRFKSYKWGLFQRLLNDDGTWNDDISGLLCQGRGLGLSVGDIN